MKTYFPFIVLAVLLSSCASIEVTTMPEEVTVRLTGSSSDMTSPCKVYVAPFQTRKAVLSKAGYESKEVSFQYSSPNKSHFVLDRKFSITSSPSGATVLKGEEVLGKTPFTLLLPATSPRTSITVSKEGFLSQELQLFHEDKKDVHHVQLIHDGPGRRFFQLTIAEHGFPIYKETRDYSQNLLEENADGAMLLHRFSERDFPVELSYVPSKNYYLVTLFLPGDKPSQMSCAHIFRLDLETLAFEPVTSGKHFETYGAVQDRASGETLYYTSLQTGRQDIWFRMGLRGNDELFLTNKLFKYHLSCTQELMLFTGVDLNNVLRPHIWKMATTDHALRTLVDLGAGERAFWSPGASRIVFQFGVVNRKDALAGVSKPRYYRIMRCEADGSRRTALGWVKGEHSDKDPVWSPDGKTIAFASNRGKTNACDFDIWLMDIDGKNARQLTHSSATDDMPSFTKDGKHIVFRSNRNLRWGIWKIAVDE